jgi:hypothetical protein
MPDGSSREEAIREDLSRYIFEKHIKPRITQGIIREHKQRPFGPHSADLDIVLRYLWKDLDKSRPRYVIVCTRLEKEYCIAEHTRNRNTSLKVTKECFSSEEELQHAIFLKRLHVLGRQAADRKPKGD